MVITGSYGEPERPCHCHGLCSVVSMTQKILASEERGSRASPPTDRSPGGLSRPIEAGLFATRFPSCPTHRALAGGPRPPCLARRLSPPTRKVRRMGLISGEVGRGSYVARGAGGAASAPGSGSQGSMTRWTVPCSCPFTGELQATRMAEVLKSIARDLARRSAVLVPPAGDAREPLRRGPPLACALRSRRRRGPDRSRPTAARRRMTLALQTAAVHGDLVVTEELGHPHPEIPPHRNPRPSAERPARRRGRGASPTRSTGPAGPVTWRCSIVMPPVLAPNCSMMGEGAAADPRRRCRPHGVSHLSKTTPGGRCRPAGRRPSPRWRPSGCSTSPG